MLRDDDILSALRDCYDPALPCNIIDLGYLTDLRLTPDPDAPGAGIPGVPPRFQLALTLTPAQADDDTEAQLRGQILNRLAGLEALSSTTVAFQHAPIWTPLRISPAGRRTLGLDGNRNLVQIR